MSTRGDGGGAWRVGGGRRGGRVRCPDHGRGGERVCGRGGGRRDPPSSAVDLNIKEVEPRPLRNLALAAKQNVTKMRHLPRPGYGRVGMECEVRSNHFRVDIMDPNLDIHHYHVAINPEVTLRAACRGIISQLVNDLHLGQLTPAYDGGNNLYTARPLSFESHMFNIKLNDSRGMEKLYDVTIRFVKRLDLDHLRQFLQGGRFDAPQEIIQALNIVLRQLPTQNYVMQSRSFFSKKFGEPTDIGYGLECWRGYYQSLHPTQMGLSLNIDISATTFYKSGSVIEFARDYLGIQGVSTYLTRKQHVDLKKALRGSRVEVIHRQNHRRRYKITGITREPLDELTFLVDGKGPRTSVVEYFQDTYHLRLRHVTWPCLQAGRDARPIYLPMEVCEIVGGQKYTNKLNAKQVSGISQATCQDRDSRRRSILDIVDANNYAADKHAREFGIHVVGEMASVKARVLPPPTLKFHDSGIERTCNPMGGAWNMINKKMVDGGSLERWACINFSFDVTEITVTRFCERLFKKCRQIGMTINPEPVIKLNYGNPHDIESVLREAKMLVAAALEEQSLQLLLIILPDIYGAYGTIKRVCETELDIVSQCCQPKNVQACSAQYMQSIAFKINVKVGGRNTALVGLSRYVTLDKNEPIIIFGADVTHPSTREDSSSSIAAVVASMDWPQVTKYRALVSAQARREEMIKDLFTVTQNDRGITVGGGMIKELLHAFYNNNSKQKPVRIIFYRDGVGEGQFNHALLSEVDAIKKACASIEEGYVPHITYVVVQKGHHTRFFPENNVQSIDTSGNILPGTVVDKGITHPAKFDFFLCSHAATKGTSRPAHYHVLWDENNFTADGLQTLTNNLCYTYACCTRSVSTVPPVYYAHLAAARARCYVEGGSEGETYEGKPLPRIKENVRKVMFYC